MICHELATGRTSRVATLDDRPVPCLSVSPDGQWIAYMQVEVSGSDLVLVENFR